MRGCAQDCPHLSSEHMVDSQREPDRAKPQRGVALGFESFQAKFIASKIESPDDRAALAAGVGQAFVGFVLRVFGRQSRRGLRIEKLRAVKPDAGRVETLQRLDLLNKFDVRAKSDFK